MEHTMERDNEAVVRRLIDEFVNAGEYDVTDELFADGYVRHDPSASATADTETQGPASFREMIEGQRTAFPDLEVTIDEVCADGDLVTFRGTSRGTHEGTFMGIDPTGETIEVTGLAMHRVQDGKLTETWANWDTLGLLEQLGASPVEREHPA